MPKDRYITSFYAPAENFDGGNVRLPDDEARHAIRVLRMVKGDRITIVDGNGGWFDAELVAIDGSDVAARIVERHERIGEPMYELTIGIGMLKSRSRFEVFLEKAVELGVTKISPLISDRAESEKINQRRCDAVLLAAMKQSGRSVLPVVTSPVLIDDFFKRNGPRFLCHESAPVGHGLDHLLSELTFSTVEELIPRISIAIGPEGGFSPNEVTGAELAGVEIASLGIRRLRAETAGIVAASLVAARLS